MYYLSLLINTNKTDKWRDSPANWDQAGMPDDNTTFFPTKR